MPVRCYGALKNLQINYGNLFHMSMSVQSTTDNAICLASIVSFQLISAKLLGSLYMKDKNYVISFYFDYTHVCTRGYS
jgi:hypothetical protein